MSLPAPILDDRTFDELLQELQQLIPTFTPEWTDFNDSEPGTTFLQLWAHLTETILYRVNRIPDRAYVKLLELVGLQLRPARTAVADLTFTPQPGFAPPRSATGVTVPRHTQVIATAPNADQPVTFETVDDLDLVRVTLSSLQVSAGGSFADLSNSNNADASTVFPFGRVPQPGNALYLGFAPPNQPLSGRPFPQAIRLLAASPTTTGTATACANDAAAPVPPVTLTWEYRRGAADPRWRRLDTYLDETAALTRDGYLVIAGPEQIDPVPMVGRITEPKYWLRCRLAGGAYPTGRPPELRFLRPNTVRAENLATIRHEVVGVSNGQPGQEFRLRKAPMQPPTLVLEVEEGPGAHITWVRREDLLASLPNDRHFSLDAATGTILFGDGRRGLIPIAGQRIIAREYRHGASAQGNVAANLITALSTSVPGVQEVTNPRPAVGGTDVETINELRQAAPARLRAMDRAVTADDYAQLAKEVGTVARATALAQTHPSHRNISVPGSVTVVVVPDSDDPSPLPSSTLLDEVCRHLSQRRTVATELHVVAPRYHEIRVTARVEAQPYASFDTVSLAVRHAINAELDPLGRPAPTDLALPPPLHDGRGVGREFGRDFPPTSLYAVIQRVPDVVAVPVLLIEVDGSPWDDPGETIGLAPDELLFGAADHIITVVPRRERDTGSLR